MAGGNEVRALFTSPMKKRSQLEIAITRNARVGSSAVHIIARKRLHHIGGKLRAQINERVRNAQHLRDFCGTAMIGTNARTMVLFPHAERYSVNVIPVLNEQTRRHGAIDTAAHGDDNFFLLSNHGFGRSML
jgi:hypothetical protein